ncbi:hypothetical protein JOB18_047237 [Solea senegalensis]|uniref:Uncharacterized protein n=1 Tax=Solea senegalensis TaxID=28829 RepID=A0AAV6SEC5_SOLSE|nr:hypothetical protein JOB18_047237 [Solea senegalensis]
MENSYECRKKKDGEAWRRRSERIPKFEAAAGPGTEDTVGPDYGESGGDLEEAPETLRLNQQYLTIRSHIVNILLSCRDSWRSCVDRFCLHWTKG